jgi:uncharacterized protein
MDGRSGREGKPSLHQRARKPQTLAGARFSGLTGKLTVPYNDRLMSTALPSVLDAWRAVSAGARYEGSLPLERLSRLRPSLTDADGTVDYVVQFGRDALDQAYVELSVNARLPLQCQRTLERYLQPVDLVQRLGLITREAQEAALPEGTEPLLLEAGAELHPAELIEDELILALPVVPIDPESGELDAKWQPVVEEAEKPNPFAALAALKDRNK